MIKVDLSAEAAAEVDRLTKARALAAGVGLFLTDGPLIGIARRNNVRRRLGRRVLLLWRLAYEDAGGRLVESMLVAATIELSRGRFDVRHADWSNAVPLAVISTQGLVWRESVQHTVMQFTSRRAARERAIAAAHATVTRTFQAGLFDRRADRARVSLAQLSSESFEEMAARLKGVEAAGALTLQSPKLLLVLVPSDAAGV
jgi:hypothetical protein